VFADIGGILPGSMPPTSKNIYEEGAQIKSFKIVKEGVYDRKGFLYHLCEEPAKYPGCSGTRCLRDVESDMQAQIAANQKGINLIHGLVEEWGLQTVQDVSGSRRERSRIQADLNIQYMRYIRENAELAVRNLLREVAKRQGGTELWARDQMDDGSPIELKVTINEEEGSAVFDFEGTGPEVNANHNCPKSVVHSAIIYCLRAMIDLDIPLNQGCLLPVDIKIPVGCFLDPSDDAAVVAGNVLTSQRITDVVLKAFGAVAASQGCMNNLSFGTDNFGYYETIAGGTGAGPGFHGTDGIQSHMTNTASVDPEILERRYPVLLRQLALREGSGGKGKWKGGEGVVRDLEFQLDMQVSILSERRVFKPFGMQGGEDAQRGSNIWVKKIGDKEERRINMGGKSTAKFHRGDRIIINTPGGGGWGEPVEEDKASSKDSKVAGMFAVDTRKGSLVDRVQTMLGA
jgi:N-methylhydantoinase B/oxoprolinase/acetone carboxylase alpha subunit